MLILTSAVEELLNLCGIPADIQLGWHLSNQNKPMRCLGINLGINIRSRRLWSSLHGLGPRWGLLVKSRLIRIRADEGAREPTRLAAAGCEIPIKRADWLALNYYVMHQQARWDNADWFLSDHVS
jgi:hypothetical protein